MSGLRVLKAGLLSLLQDAGRHGWQHLGVSTGGPVDIHAAAWANHLLGNAWGTPLLEVALGGLRLRAEADCWLALCGAQVPIRVDGEARPGWSRFALRAGQELELGFAAGGQRAYLAVAGGFRVEPVLGSVATLRREGLGGLHGDGRALEEGDLLPCAASGEAFERGASVPWPYVPDYRETPMLRVLPGGDVFEPEQRAAFFERTWQLSPQSDRMGARLHGEPIRAPRRQWSLGMVRGAIQVPPDGQPIVLQADHQSMGGYPLLGFVHPLDLGRLAQCLAHAEVRFAETTLEAAQDELRRFYRFFRG
ncbi:MULTISPECIES: biotin-dependent carboxyltransferase family protein [unclassified Pseudomonas]|uniref:5-oxoprolinase subunit C family protein n=1 Tax=unclassified Pseudomonas TaxID=196821 RepID=UPI000AB3176D|nr:MULTISPECIES: biotin-dependent carboxyltransferase family protein [unclassified Pseudomonas]QOF82875.1 biotin-dependent carboxyltransferase family protein [Pseudomonas sp. ADPe]